jgi:hypothetical protein
MTEYDNTNRGSIWKNDKKETDKHPDFTGSLNVGGVEYWVSAWKRKEGAAAKAPALSFSIKPKDEPGRPTALAVKSGVASKAVSQLDDMDDEIPF